MIEMMEMAGPIFSFKWQLTSLVYSHDVRKSIARVMTVINCTQRHQLRLFYAKKKYIPLDLRPKQTRAIRRRLTKHEKSLTTEKQKKKTMHFPQRIYAIKVSVSYLQISH